MVTRPALVGEASEDWRWYRNDNVTRSRNTAIRLSWRSPRQDDFAKGPVLNQMAQGFARLAEGIRSTIGLMDPLTISGRMSRHAVAIAVGDWANREKPAIRARFQIRSVTSIVVLRPAE